MLKVASTTFIFLYDNNAFMLGNVTADVYIGPNWNSAMTNTATGYTKQFILSNK